VATIPKGLSKHLVAALHDCRNGAANCWIPTHPFSAYGTLPVRVKKTF
jgi:hypothetical protein